MSASLAATTLSLATFLAGSLSTAIWWKLSKAGPKVNTLRVVTASFFTIVALTVTANLLILGNNFRDYVQRTEVRDTQQEACIKFLMGWSSSVYDSRTAYTASEDASDREVIALINQLAGGVPLTSEDASRFTDLTLLEMQARRGLTQTIGSQPRCNE